ncbi:hypothetical protein D3227_13250 [Mesorhizobium waimense]|uniref:Uncharacterized protein n=1 Tax=Mesorhizobium waimense TaxID=1300307 RepID=A0A3A5KTS4_9HYPH|nr:hypothetical protein [Mesorhizobium waimense]RJT39766.1 hypothetical protein D3227_13250 [Mesorhizobium waimense]
MYALLALTTLAVISASFIVYRMLLPEQKHTAKIESICRVSEAVFAGALIALVIVSAGLS